MPRLYKAARNNELTYLMSAWNASGASGQLMVELVKLYKQLSTNVTRANRDELLKDLVRIPKQPDINAEVQRLRSKYPSKTEYSGQ